MPQHSVFAEASQQDSCSFGVQHAAFVAVSRSLLLGVATDMGFTFVDMFISFARASCPLTHEDVFVERRTQTFFSERPLSSSARLAGSAAARPARDEVAVNVDLEIAARANDSFEELLCTLHAGLRPGQR